MGFQCHFFTQRPMVTWPIGVFDCRVSADRPVRWHSGGDSPLHKEQLWALRTHWWEDMLDACRWSARYAHCSTMSRNWHTATTARLTKAAGDDHSRSASWAVPRGHGACGWFACLGTGNLTGQQDPAEGEPACTMPVGEKSKMTDANEPFGQHMQKEAA